MTLVDSLRLQKADCQALQAAGIDGFQIESTSRCNLRCLMCPRSGSGVDMGDDLVDLIVRKFSVLSEIGVSGLGEPFLSQNTLRFLREAKRHGLRAFVPTNATCVRDETAAELVELGS